MSERGGEGTRSGSTEPPCDDLLGQPLRHSLVVHRLGLLQTLLRFLPFQAGVRMLGAVTVGVCEPITTSCTNENGRHVKMLRGDSSKRFSFNSLDVQELLNGSLILGK